VLRIWFGRFDLPFGDAVTGPQYRLQRPAREAGLSAVFNGEGGDQLFAGGRQPMISRPAYAGLYGTDSREQLYLRSYHRFYVSKMYSTRPEFLAQVGPARSARRCFTYLRGGEGDHLPEPHSGSRTFR